MIKKKLINSKNYLVKILVDILSYTANWRHPLIDKIQGKL
jgi:hypothetical protein